MICLLVLLFSFFLFFFLLAGHSVNSILYQRGIYDPGRSGSRHRKLRRTACGYLYVIMRGVRLEGLYLSLSPPLCVQPLSVKVQMKLVAALFDLYIYTYMYICVCMCFLCTDAFTSIKQYGVRMQVCPSRTLSYMPETWFLGITRHEPLTEPNRCTTYIHPPHVLPICLPTVGSFFNSNIYLFFFQCVPFFCLGDYGYGTEKIY